MENKQLKPNKLKAIDLLIHENITQKEVANQVGIHEATLYRWFADASFCEQLEKEQRKYLQALGIQALKKITKLANDDTISPAVQFQAAKDLADRSGYKPVEKSQVEQTGAPTINIVVSGVETKE